MNFNKEKYIIKMKNSDVFTKTNVDDFPLVQFPSIDYGINGLK